MGAESGVRRRVKGLSEGEFRQRFGTEAQCRAALFSLRWGKGWACPGCGHAGYAELKGRAVYQCNRCKRQVGLTAGTVFHWTKLPLTVWFLAIYHLTQSKGGMSSVELARRLGTRQPTAWLIKHKLMAAMAAREAEKPKLAGRVEMDDAYLGGQRAGGKRGRGAAGKTPFVAAVETTAERKPRRLRLTVVKGFRKKEIATLAKRDLAAGSNVVTDGLSCWTAVSEAGCDHFPMVTGSGPNAAKWVPFTPAPSVTALAARSEPQGRLGQHRARQHQDGTRRHLPSRQRQARPALPDQLRLALVWGFGCQALNVGIVFLPVSSSSRWRQPSRGLVHDVPRGARPLARIIAPQACIRRTRGDPDHDAAMRIGGEAPGRRAHSSTRHESHRKARVTATSDRHRQPAGEPWAGRETVSGVPLRPSPLTPPDGGRHRPASRRWSPNATAR